MGIHKELQRIKGIGDSRAKKLVDSGIKSMEDLSKLNETQMNELGLNKRVISYVKEYFEDIEATEVKSGESKAEEYESHLLEWAAEGYHVEPVEKELSKSDEPKKVIDKYIKAVEASRKIRDSVIDMNVAEHLQEAEKLLDLTFDLGKINQWKDRYEDLNRKLEARDLKYELEDMRIPEIEGRIDGVIRQLEETMDVNSVLEEVEDIKREFQENYFVKEFVKDAEDLMEREKVKVTHEVEKIPNKAMPIDDLFLFHGPRGMLLIKWYKHKHSPERGVMDARNIVSDIRMFARSGQKLAPNMVKKISTEDDTDIYVTRGNTLLLASVVSGDISDYGKKVLVNSVKLIEKEIGPSLKEWDRTYGEPEYLEKVMKALLLLSLRNRKGGGKK